MYRVSWARGTAVSMVTVVALVTWSTVSVGAAPLSGSDISWPQCGQAYPPRAGFGLVGVNDGRPYTANPCLASEYRWALTAGIVEYYMNTANPGVAAGDAFNYGYNAARDAYASATARVNAGPGHVWWLDVETGNSWSGDRAVNTVGHRGLGRLLPGQRIAVGIYSTRYQWGVITGGASIPVGPQLGPRRPQRRRGTLLLSPARSFSGGPVVMTQYTTQFDYDYLCPGAVAPGSRRRPRPRPGDRSSQPAEGALSALKPLADRDLVAVGVADRRSPASATGGS